jgi:hypothetical protein
LCRRFVSANSVWSSGVRVAIAQLHLMDAFSGWAVTLSGVTSITLVPALGQLGEQPAAP